MQTDEVKANGKNDEKEPKAKPVDVVNLSMSDAAEIGELGAKISVVQDALLQRALVLAEINELAGMFRATNNKRIERVQEIARSHDLPDISKTHGDWTFDAEKKTLSFTRK